MKTIFWGLFDYSVIIPAWNESEHLPVTLPTLAAAMAMQKFSGEMIVVDNNSTDDTAAIARKYGAKVVFEPINSIALARNAGAKAAMGRILIFMDADTIIGSDLLQETLRRMTSNEYYRCGD